MTSTSGAARGAVVLAARAVAGTSMAWADEPPPPQPASVGPSDQAACVAQVSSLLGPPEVRDDIRLLHNELSKDAGIAPSQALQSTIHVSGSRTACLGLLPPVVVPPHPTGTP